MSTQPATFFTPPAVATINHLLAREAWARAALAEHAGKEALIDAGAAALRVRVARDGMLEAGQGEGAANVTIRVRMADLPLIAADRERAFSYVKIEGDAQFANTLSQLSRGLRWEAEADLERVLGPIAANRVAQGARGAAAAQRTAHTRLAENLAEILLEEQPVLVRRAAAEDFSTDVNRLRDDVERAAKRLARLEQQLARRAGAT
jgi:ubiquinone biosynthesis protein UbiJ